MSAALKPDPAEPSDPFGWALAFILRWEGGKVDDPADKGGRTAYGITWKTYADWCAAHAQPMSDDVWNIMPSEVRAIYKERYWDAVKGDELATIDPRMALCVFDAAVQSGPKTAATTFQRTVQAEPDGAIGKVTLSCYRLRRMSLGDTQLLEVFMERRRGFYAAIVLRDPTQRKFSKGWKNRRNSLRQMVGLNPEEE